MQLIMAVNPKHASSCLRCALIFPTCALLGKKAAPGWTLNLHSPQGLPTGWIRHATRNQQDFSSMLDTYLESHFASAGNPGANNSSPAVVREYGNCIKELITEYLPSPNCPGGEGGNPMDKVTCIRIRIDFLPQELNRNRTDHSYLRLAALQEGRAFQILQRVSVGTYE